MTIYIQHFYVGDIGKAIELTVKDENGTAIDISTATTKTIYLQPPGGSAVAKDGVFTTDGTDGKLKYVTVDGDLSKAGPWEAQAYVVMPDTTFHTSTTGFEVKSNL